MINKQQRQKVLFLMVFSWCMILTLIPLAYSKTNYNESGNFDVQYQLGTGVFDEDVEDSTTGTITISSPVQQPLVVDLDGDGGNEIAIITGSNVRLYEDKELNIVDSASFTYTSDFISNMITHDIDGDGYTEIILATSNPEQVNIFEYNGTSFHSQNTISMSGLANHLAEGDIMIKCGQQEECFMAYYDSEGPYDTANAQVYGVAFNSTSFGDEKLLSTNANTRYGSCFPDIKSIAYADYDNDAENDDEYIFSFYEVDNMGTDQVVIIYADINSTFGVELELENEISDIDGDSIEPISGTQSSCTDSGRNIGSYVTSPLVFDTDGAAGNGLETALGVQITADDFKIALYEPNGNEYDDYPEIGDSTGSYLSNMVRMNAFDNSDTYDESFCVMGFNAGDNSLLLLCGAHSNYATGLFEHREFDFDTTSYYNLTENSDHYSNIIHAAQMSQDKIEGNNNLHEVLSSYGVFELDYAGLDDLDLIYENDKNEGALLSCNVEKTSTINEDAGEDLLIMTSGNLYYVDDSISNEPAEIDEVYFNPCAIDRIVKINETMDILVRVDDQNPEAIGDDPVSANITVYAGDDNEQEVSHVNATSGSQLPGQFEINKTGFGYSILIEAWDSENPDQIDTQTYTLDVGAIGVERGDDCTNDVTTSSEDEAEAEEEEAAAASGLETDADSNAVRNATTEVGALIGIGGTLIWLIIMFSVAVAAWWTGTSRNYPTGATMGVVLLLEVLLITIGWNAGIFSTGLIISIIVTMIVVMGIWLGRFIVAADQR